MSKRKTSHRRSSFSVRIPEKAIDNHSLNKGAPQPKARPSPSLPGKTGAGTAWLYGIHAVQAALNNPKRRHRRLLVTASGAEALGALDRYTFVEPADRQAIEALFPPGTVHQGVALLADPLPELALDEILANLAEQAVLLALDQVTDPQNIGAVLRSAAAFGAAAVLVPDHGAPEVTGALAKAASGALERVPLVRVGNLAQSLDHCKAAGCWIVGLAGEAEALLADIDLKGRSVLVLGAEGPGMRRLTREKCDFLARLPTGGPIAHLNVSNAAAVSLYEWARRTPADKN
ncbi:MAG: 23S rRNA (guanosine(2251)-2'-O)-methyltransferase RlmB [Alphaproteobacteria bacterium]